MKKMIALTLSAAMLTTAPAVGFAHWSDSYSDGLVQQKVITAEDAMLKNPDTPATRGDLARIVALLKDLTYAGGGKSFSDVEADHPYYTYCEAAAAAGYIAGYADGTFRPDSTVTRQDAFSIFGRAYQIAGDDSQTFTDIEEVDAYAKDSITGMKKLGIVSGYPDGSVQPRAEITNGEIMTIAYFLEQQFGQKEDDLVPVVSPSTAPTSKPSSGGGGGGGGSYRPPVTTPTPKPSTSPSPSPAINTGSAKLSQAKREETLTLEGGYEVTMPYAEITVTSAVPVKQAQWVMMTEENDNLIQAFSRLKAQAQTLEGSSLIAKKNGRYLFKVQDVNGALTYTAIDVTGIPSEMEQYIAVGEENSDEEMTEFVLRLEPNMQDKVTRLTSAPLYGCSKRWVMKKADLAQVDSVWYNRDLEQLVEDQEECQMPVTLKDNGDYVVIYQDRNGNFMVKEFALRMAYDMNLKAEAAPRTDEQQAAEVTVSYDQQPAEIRVLYSDEALEAPEPPAIPDPSKTYPNEWQYYQKHGEDSVLVEGNTFEAKKDGWYCVYAKAEDGTEMMTKLRVSVTRPAVKVDSMIWLNEKDVKVTFSVTPNENAAVTRLAWKPNFQLPAGGFFLLPKDLEELALDQTSVIVKDAASMTRDAKVLIAVEDEWGNASYCAENSYAKPSAFLSVGKQEQEGAVSLSIENVSAFSEVKWVRVDDAVEEADAPDVFEASAEAAQTLSDSTLPVTQNGTYLFWAKDEAGIEQITTIRIDENSVD